MKNPFSRREILQLEKADCIATVLFCDVKGYTKFLTNITPAQAIKRLNAYSKIAVKTVEENHGTVAKLVGDALLVYWLEEKYANHAALACQFASTIQQRLSVLPFEIKTHVGIHTGEIALVSIDHGTYRSLEPIGDTVNTANRSIGLCSEFKVRAIASDAVIRRTTETTGWSNFGTVMVKGKNEPLAFYGLV